MPTPDEALRALEDIEIFNTRRPTAARLDVLRAFIEQAKADAVDAARYRIWRTKFVADGQDGMDLLFALGDAWSADEVDRCCDAAIAARSAKTGEKT